MPLPFRLMFSYYFVRTHMQDLKEVTDFLHYEGYRRKQCPHTNGDTASLDEKPEVRQENGGIISESNI